MSPGLTNSDGTFPLALISPQYYTGKDGRSWSLVSIGLKKAPDWTVEVTNLTPHLCVFREITYLDPDGQVEGLGRSWIRFTKLGFKLLSKSLNPLNPTPLGVAIESLIRGDFTIELAAEVETKRVLNPYRLSTSPISSYRRAIRQISTNKYIAFTEEDILRKK